MKKTTLKCNVKSTFLAPEDAKTTGELECSYTIPNYPETPEEVFSIWPNDGWMGKYLSMVDAHENKGSARKRAYAAHDEWTEEHEEELAKAFHVGPDGYDPGLLHERKELTKRLVAHITAAMAGAEFEFSPANGGYPSKGDLETATEIYEMLQQKLVSAKDIAGAAAEFGLKVSKSPTVEEIGFICKARRLAEERAKKESPLAALGIKRK